MLKNQSLDNKEKCEFNMISCFSCWTNTVHTSPVMKLVHWQFCFMRLWIHFLLRWAFQTQLRNSKPQIFSCFMGGKQGEEHGRGAPNPAAASGLHWSWVKKNKNPSGACLGRMVQGELCQQGESLTQTQITAQFRGNGRQNCIYKPCSVRKTAVFEKVLSIQIITTTCQKSLQLCGHLETSYQSPKTAQPSVHTDFDFTLSELSNNSQKLRFSYLEESSLCGLFEFWCSQYGMW